jgi:hypothetical protein
VPGLPETLQRVVVSAEEERQLARFAEDREHGAAQMAGWVLDALEGAWVQAPESAILLVSVAFFGNLSLLPKPRLLCKYACAQRHLLLHQACAG